MFRFGILNYFRKSFSSSWRAEFGVDVVFCLLLIFRWFVAGRKNVLTGSWKCRFDIESSTAQEEKQGELIFQILANLSKFCYNIWAFLKWKLQIGNFSRFVELKALCVAPSCFSKHRNFAVNVFNNYGFELFPKKIVF